ncbi:MAG: peroxiredoxin-like family protein [Acidimicrobiales bacterium]
MRQQRERLEELGASALAVGFSPAEPLAALADHLDWPWPFLSDPDRVLYHRLGLGRARLRDVYTPATVRLYRQAAQRGEAVHRPVEDSRQLGGDAVVRAGRVVRLFRPASPDDRPPVDTLLAALAEVADPSGGAGPG